MVPDPIGWCRGPSSFLCLWPLGHGVDVGLALRERGAGTEIDVMVSPGSKKSAMQGIDPWRKRLIVKVQAPPEKGAANEEVEELLSMILGAKATITSGHTNRLKTLYVPMPVLLVKAKLEGENA